MILLFKNYKIYVVLVLIVFFSINSCKDFLQEEVYTQYDPDILLETESGINSVLVSAYDELQGTISQRMLTLSMLPGDAVWDWGGGFNSTAVIYMNYEWDPQSPHVETRWNLYYRAIRNSNALLDEIDNVTDLNPERINGLKAEATFIRAVSYYYLWDLYGPVPLIKTTQDLNLSPSRPSEEEFSSFVESELQNAAENLPIQNQEGRATKGAALAYLGRFYLNQYEWQNAVDVNQQVIELDQYSLYQGNVENMFAVENEGEVQKEIIFERPNNPTRGLTFTSYNFPPKYPILPNQLNYGTQMNVYEDFYRSYHADDERRNWFLTEYTDTDGVHQDMLNDPDNIARGVRCFKFVPDPNAAGPTHGNDFPMFRYAEVLLNRAEALNEINGPNEESISLLNQIRNRVGAPVYTLSDFTSKEELRNAILAERGWEFIYEGLRRSDLVRHGKLIEYARARGASNAVDYMIRYPIPQSEININPNIEQNEGYN